MSRIPAIVLASAIGLVLLVAPSTAGAATWGSDLEACGGYNTSERGSGQMDTLGRLYVPCSQSATAAGTLYHDNYVAVFNAAGDRIARIPMDFTPDDGRTSTDRVSDVAPSPDGSFLYVIKYAEYRAYRFDRQPDGSYRANPNWRLAPYPYAGGGAAVVQPAGQFLATDAAGSIYFSSGLWSCNAPTGCADDAIVKYRPDGSYVTRFGQKVGGSWALGHSAGSFAGLAVTADGRRVFVTDVNNSRVQRFDRAADGSYGAVLSMGMDQFVDPNRWGACGFDQPGALDDALAAPYDLAMSARGELLVMNTTCYATATFHAYMPAGSIEIRRFGQDGTPRGTIVSRSHYDTRVHGIAVDRVGNIHLPQAKSVLRPAAGWSDAGADAGGGGPMGGAAAIDVTAPVITALNVPAATDGPAVAVGLAATDASGVTQMRVGQDGVLGAWQPYSTGFTFTLTGGYGAHRIEVEVRDAVGNVSTRAGANVTWNAPAPAPQPQPEPQPEPQPQPQAPAPAAPGGGQAAPAAEVDRDEVVGGGGAAAAAPEADDRPKPVITSAKMPAQLVRGRRLPVRIRATGEAKVTLVRFSTVGRWSKWQRLRGRNFVFLPKGIGWKGVLVQVRDTTGARSRPWFQPVLMGPRGTRWLKGTTARNRIRGKARSEHIDSSNFDGKRDIISCSSGWDTVYAQPEDFVSKSCERVIRVKLPAF